MTPVNLARCLAVTALLAAAPTLHAQGPPNGAPADSTKKSPMAEGLPLQPARVVSFTTNAGSWMSVDVSPDGRSIVFDHLGDLYLLPIEGGRAAPLTRGMAVDAQPRFSPDGDCREPT